MKAIDRGWKAAAWTLVAALAVGGCATAATGEGSGEDALAPRVYAQSPDAVYRAVVEFIATTQDWELAEADRDAHRVRANHYTKTLGFRDKIEVTVRPADAGGAVVEGRSTSVIGIGDFGQNRRNLMELFDGVGAALGGGAEPAGG